MVRAAVLRSAGANCNNETEQAFRAVGARTRQVHVNEFIDAPEMLAEFDILAIPGGFSYGDYIGAGAILAHQLASKLRSPLQEFVDDGKILIGICNGFQVLVRLGLLPGDGMEAALTRNDSGNFECRWVTLVDREGHETRMPVAHGEGKFVTDAETLEKMTRNNQIMYRYSASSFPQNPNGSVGDIAGVCNREGNVIGLMPHPERHLSFENHPQWTRVDRKEGEGLDFFRMVVGRVGESRKRFPTK